MSVFGCNLSSKSYKLLKVAEKFRKNDFLAFFSDSGFPESEGSLDSGRLDSTLSKLFNCNYFKFQNLERKKIPQKSPKFSFLVTIF